MAKFVRIKPKNKRRGNVVENYTVRFNHRSTPFRGSAGWYRVDDRLADYLQKNALQVANDIESPSIFDICDSEQAALELEAKDAEKPSSHTPPSQAQKPDELPALDKSGTLGVEPPANDEIEPPAAANDDNPDAKKADSLPSSSAKKRRRSATKDIGSGGHEERAKPVSEEKEKSLTSRDLASGPESSGRTGIGSKFFKK